MKIVMVYWIDAGQKMGWQQEEALEGWAEDVANFLCTTIGLVKEETDDYLVLVQGTAKGSVLNPIRIRKQNIIGVEEFNGKTESN
jgi:hypothetical protein